MRFREAIRTGDRVRAQEAAKRARLEPLQLYIDRCESSEQGEIYQAALRDVFTAFSMRARAEYLGIGRYRTQARQFNRTIRMRAQRDSVYGDGVAQMTGIVETLRQYVPGTELTKDRSVLQQIREANLLRTGEDLYDLAEKTEK